MGRLMFYSWSAFWLYIFVNGDPMLPSAVLLLTYRSRSKMKAAMAKIAPVIPIPIAVQQAHRCNCKAHRIFARFRMAA